MLTEQMEEESLGLHHRVMEAEAHVRAAAEGRPGEAVPVLAVLGRKTIRIETLRVRPHFRQTLRQENVR